MNIRCPKHGIVQSNANNGFIHPDLPITDYCPQCVGEAQTARYEDAVRRAKEKNPNWKPLTVSVTPRKMVHPSSIVSAS